MDDGIKQRLIGAVILVALMVIFLPMLLSNDDLDVAEVLVDIPERPIIPSFEITEPTKPSEQREAKKTPAVPESKPEPKIELRPESKPETKPQEMLQELADKEVDENNLPVSWALQVASFQDRNNAEKLRDKLRDAGYKAYIKYRLDVEPKMIRVLVGPVLDRKEIDKIKAAVANEHKLEGVVVRYLP